MVLNRPMDNYDQISFLAKGFLNLLIFYILINHSIPYFKIVFSKTSVICTSSLFAYIANSKTTIKFYKILSLKFKSLNFEFFRIFFRLQAEAYSDPYQLLRCSVLQI